ncbi:unnamed protein product [Bursaphelenchus xylophilus]|uniref:(pine wood nematode) hypothetical protein n=1 Tax=Bursaphelenchus xylophilus TaxID=6326 RepID=A0A1I7RR55_BURXY|nr:unnamed protein product [Bursaphelenchus xylophilus]CAG9130846.1 unnamed protein product [Bursaphelenchus xylophilus]
MDEIIYDHLSDDVYDRNEFNSVESTISMIMFSNGDHHSPEQDAVAFVTSLANTELRNLLNVAGQRASEEGRRKVELCDVLWCLRKKTVLLSRFFRYLKEKEEIFSFDFGSLAGVDQIKLASFKDALSLLLPDCVHLDLVLKGIDEPVEDVEKNQRMERIVEYIRTLDSETYIEFSRARRTCLYKLPNSVLMEWLGQTDPLKMEIIIVFSFLASEVVAEMVENAFKCKVEEEAVSSKSIGPQIGVVFYKMALRRHRGHLETGYLLQ